MTGAANPHQVSERITLEPLGRHAAANFKGQTLAESGNALMLSEQGYPPRIYFPPSDVRLELFKKLSRETHCPYKGDACYWSLTAGGETLEAAAWAYPAPLPEMSAISGYLSFADEIEIAS